MIKSFRSVGPFRTNGKYFNVELRYRIPQVASRLSTRSTSRFTSASPTYADPRILDKTPLHMYHESLQWSDLFHSYMSNSSFPPQLQMGLRSPLDVYDRSVWFHSCLNVAPISHIAGYHDFEQNRFGSPPEFMIKDRVFLIGEGVAHSYISSIINRGPWKATTYFDGPWIEDAFIHSFQRSVKSVMSLDSYILAKYFATLRLRSVYKIFVSHADVSSYLSRFRFHESDFHSIPAGRQFNFYADFIMVGDKPFQVLHPHHPNISNMRGEDANMNLTASLEKILAIIADNCVVNGICGSPTSWVDHVHTELLKFFHLNQNNSALHQLASVGRVEYHSSKSTSTIRSGTQKGSSANFGLDDSIKIKHIDFSYVGVCVVLPFDTELFHPYVPSFFPIDKAITDIRSCGRGTRDEWYLERLAELNEFKDENETVDMLFWNCIQNSHSIAAAAVLLYKTLTHPQIQYFAVVEREGGHPFIGLDPDTMMFNETGVLKNTLILSSGGAGELDTGGMIPIPLLAKEREYIETSFDDTFEELIAILPTRRADPSYDSSNSGEVSRCHVHKAAEKVLSLRTSIPSQFALPLKGSPSSPEHESSLKMEGDILESTDDIALSMIQRGTRPLFVRAQMHPDADFRVMDDGLGNSMSMTEGWSKEDEEQYLYLLQRSRYCLVTRDRGPTSMKLFECLQMGIPVIVTWGGLSWLPYIPNDPPLLGSSKHALHLETNRFSHPPGESDKIDPLLSASMDEANYNRRSDLSDTTYHVKMNRVMNIPDFDNHFGDLDYNSLIQPTKRNTYIANDYDYVHSFNNLSFLTYFDRAQMLQKNFLEIVKPQVKADDPHHDSSASDASIREPNSILTSPLNFPTDTMPLWNRVGYVVEDVEFEEFLQGYYAEFLNNESVWSQHKQFVREARDSYFTMEATMRHIYILLRDPGSSELGCQSNLPMSH